MAFAQSHPVYTIGFTQKNAQTFFKLLNQNGIKRLLDVRINNTSQLAAFAKRDDLAYFLEALCDAEYVHEPLLAPTKVLLKQYRSGELDWERYEKEFLNLLAEREIETYISPAFFAVPTVLLCSEATAEHCHRRLVLNYLHAAWGSKDSLSIIHL